MDHFNLIDCFRAKIYQKPQYKSVVDLYWQYTKSFFLLPVVYWTFHESPFSVLYKVKLFLTTSSTAGILCVVFSALYEVRRY